MSKLISRDTCIHYMPCCRKASGTSEQVQGEGSSLLIAQSPNLLGSHLHGNSRPGISQIHLPRGRPVPPSARYRAGQSSWWLRRFTVGLFTPPFGVTRGKASSPSAMCTFNRQVSLTATLALRHLTAVGKANSGLPA
jgi:hypothetical protein